MVFDNYKYKRALNIQRNNPVNDDNNTRARTGVEYRVLRVKLFQLIFGLISISVIVKIYIDAYSAKYRGGSPQTPNRNELYAKYAAVRGCDWGEVVCSEKTL